MAVVTSLLRGARSALAIRRPLPLPLTPLTPLPLPLLPLRRNLLPNLLRVGTRVVAVVAATGLASVTAAYGLRSAAVSCDSGGGAEPRVAYDAGGAAASGRSYYDNAEARQTVSLWEKPTSDGEETVDVAPSEETGQRQNSRRWVTLMLVLGLPCCGYCWGTMFINALFLMGPMDPNQGHRYRWQWVLCFPIYLP